MIVEQLRLFLFFCGTSYFVENKLNLFTCIIGVLLNLVSSLVINYVRGSSRMNLWT